MMWYLKIEDYVFITHHVQKGLFINAILWYQEQPEIVRKDRNSNHEYLEQRKMDLSTQDIDLFFAFSERYIYHDRNM